MYRFIESICIIDGMIRNLEFHQERMRRSCYKFLGIDTVRDLEKTIFSNKIPAEGQYKCRIVYGSEIESVEFVPYRIKPVHSIRLIENNQIEYAHKFLDRKPFELLLDSVTEDEILIVRKGQVTDTSFSNILFFDGENWITPSSYLLNGTMRQSLLKSGEITEEEVNPKDLNRFISCKLINAMMGPDESPDLDISIIR